jgi:hypothetical protein
LPRIYNSENQCHYQLAWDGGIHIRAAADVMAEGANI